MQLHCDFDWITSCRIHLYDPLSPIHLQLKEQERTLRKAVSQIDLDKRQFANDRVNNLLDQCYTDLDQTMESLSPAEPSEELLQHRRLIIRDSERIARVKEGLIRLGAQEAYEREDEKLSSANPPANELNEPQEFRRRSYRSWRQASAAKL